MTSKRLNLHHFLPRSRANGPGIRSVAWTHVCTLACPGCFNPQTHSTEAQLTLSVSDLLDQILVLKDIEGVTITGGEPLQQSEAVLELLTRIKSETTLSTLVFTGFDWQEVQRLPFGEKILGQIDVLIAGRYDDSLREALSLIGSSNQEVHFLTARYSQIDLDKVPPAEIVITPEGEVLATGIDPLGW